MKHVFWIFVSIVFEVVAIGAHSPLNRRSPRRGYDYGHIGTAKTRRQSSPNKVAVTGPSSGNGYNSSLPIRQEIRDLQQHNETWTLYLLGLDWLQYTSQSDPLSWYQVTGIHGRPFVPWNNVQSGTGDAQNGYCAHVSILFPVWHRPYLALFEQILFKSIQDIATWYPDQSDRLRYQAAAVNFRIPYWDWAAVPTSGDSIVPKILTDENVDIDGPNGFQTIQNPLFNYKFQPLNTTDLPDSPLSLWSKTLRYPTTMEADATPQDNLMVQYMDADAASFRNRLYNLFTNYDNYTKFSNEAWIPTNNTEGYDSIESIHDEIHGLTGGYGHMTYIEYSAFDPIFFLHHAMVDRIFAMWQILNPSSYVTPQVSLFGTFTTSIGEIENISTPLTPFYDQNGNFWTPASARYTETFGYTYGETMKTPNITFHQRQANIRSVVNSLYGSTAPANTAQTSNKRGLKGRKTNIHLKSDSAVTKTLFKRDDDYYEWIANIIFDKHSLGGTFFIYLFLDVPMTSPIAWSSDPAFVGLHCTFSRSDTCTTCDANHLVSATLPLTSALLERITQGQLSSLDPQDAQPYLQSNLRYRITLDGKTEVSNGDVPSMKVTIVSALVRRAANCSEFPSWGPLVVRFEVEGGR